LRYIKHRFTLLEMYGANGPCQVEGARGPVRINIRGRELGSLSRMGFHRSSQACQLRRLYQLFGLDPTTQEETIVIEKSEDKMMSGRDPDVGDGLRCPHSSWALYVIIHSIHALVMAIILTSGSQIQANASNPRPGRRASSGIPCPKFRATALPRDLSRFPFSGPSCL